jgi:hypothetical protein
MGGFMQKLLFLKEVLIPNKCTANCHFRIRYPFANFWYCTLYWQSIGHIVHAKKCSVTSIELYKSMSPVRSSNDNLWEMPYCLDCPFVNEDPAGSRIPWCSLHKILIKEIKHKNYMQPEEKKLARKKRFKKCNANFALLDKKHNQK